MTIESDHKNRIIYSCSGCSSAAQMANWIAIQLDREQIAEMSCIAGVGGGVKPLVVRAMSADFIIGIDGCPLHCVEHCLKREGMETDIHYDLSRAGVKKDNHLDFDREEAEKVLAQIRLDLSCLSGEV
jgi:uncharacterized metal-binding protein